MENVTGRNNDKVKVKVPLGKEERENLLACATSILENVGDDEVLESIVELLQDLEMNTLMQEGLKSFRKNGWAFIRRTQKGNYDSDFLTTPTSSLMMMDLDEINLNLKSRLDQYRIDDLGWVFIEKTHKPQGQNFGKSVDGTQTSSSSMMLELEQETLNSRNKQAGGFDYETHPLNMELILKNIFKYSSVTDLKNIRLVSKKWRDVSLSFWRRKAVLQTEKLFEDYICQGWVVHNYAENDDCDHDGHARGSVERLIKNGSKFIELPFQRYEIDSSVFRDDRTSTNRKISILELFSSSIQHLSLHCDDLDILSMVLTKLPELRFLHLELDCQHLLGQYMSIIDNDKYRKCPFTDLQPAIPNLCTLELEIGESNDNPARIANARLPLPWKKIFQSASTLKSFRVTPRSGAMFTDITQSILEIRQEGRFSTLNLEELDIFRPLHQYPSSVAERIIECQFPIQTLRLNLENGDNPSRLLMLLEAHAKTLECIHCNIYPDEEFMPVIPLAPYFQSKIRLPNLKELGFSSGFVRAFHLLSSMDVPNLESLRIEGSAYYFTRGNEKKQLRNVMGLVLKSDAFMMSSYILPNLKTFFYNVSWNLRANEIEILGKTMPNLTDLCIPLCKNMLTKVYQLWPGLQSLHVLTTKFTYQLMDDFTITGIPFQNYCDEVQGSRGPNITDLKNLRKFVLESKYCRDKTSIRIPRGLITDLSAVYGFLQLPELRVLFIESVCKFSPRVIMALENHISEMNISPPDIYQDLSGDDEDAFMNACRDTRDQN